MREETVGNSLSGLHETGIRLLRMRISILFIVSCFELEKRIKLQNNNISLPILKRSQRAKETVVKRKHYHAILGKMIFKWKFMSNFVFHCTRPPVTHRFLFKNSTHYPDLNQDRFLRSPTSLRLRQHARLALFIYLFIYSFICSRDVMSSINSTVSRLTKQTWKKHWKWLPFRE